MVNRTLVIDDDTLRRARIRVLEEGTSVNVVVRADTAATFVDTNVIVCAFDVGDERKREVALQLLGDSSLHLVVSAQVLNEFSSTVTRRLEPTLEEEKAHDVVRHLSEGDVVPIDASLVDTAIALARRHRLALGDAAILAAARRWGCDELLTENMSDGAVIEGVRIRNPFRA